MHNVIVYFGPMVDSRLIMGFHLPVYFPKETVYIFVSKANKHLLSL